MSYQADTWARSVPGLNRGEKAFLRAVAWYHDYRTDSFRPVSNKQLATDMEISERQVIRLAQQLEDRQLIRRSRPHLGTGAKTTYEFPQMPALRVTKGDTVSPLRMTLATEKGDTMSPTIRNVGSSRDNLENQNHHTSGAMKDWLEIKKELERQLPAQDYDTFIRPMFLSKLFGDCLGLCVPPNYRIVEHAKQCGLLQELIRARGYSGGIIGRYPTDDELARMREIYPNMFAELPAALRARVEKKPPERATG